jgi:hypothetical protein
VEYRQVEQNRELPINPLPYCQLIFSKSVKKDNMRKRDSSINRSGKILYTYAEE